jgi:hypothetical protein
MAVTELAARLARYERHNRWVDSMGGLDSPRYRGLYIEAYDFAGPDYLSDYLDMARHIDEDHQARKRDRAARVWAEIARRHANDAAAVLQRVNDIRLAAGLPVAPRAAVARNGWDELAAVVELATRPKVVDLVGPKGYIHGWIFVGIPGPGQEVYHPQHGRGTVTDSGSGRVKVSFDAGHSKTFPVRSDQSRGHFEQMTDDELAAEYNRSEGSRASAIVGELDRRDQADQDAAAQAKSQRVSALYAEQPKTEADQNRVYQSLVNEGENREDAWAHAHGTTPVAMRKQAAVQQLRSQGYKGSGFDALTRDAFRDEVRRRTISAEGATNGYMLGPAGKKAGIDPWSLFTGPESRARKYASPELKEWWDQNGRPTAADFQASLMGQKAGMKPADFYASVTGDDPAAVELSEEAPAPRAEVDAELRFALGLAARSPDAYRELLPPVGDLARAIGLRLCGPTSAATSWLSPSTRPSCRAGRPPAPWRRGCPGARTRSPPRWSGYWTRPRTTATR